MAERTELIQKSLFERREFRLREAGIETYIKDYEVDSTNFWPFDDFEKKNRLFTEKNPKLLTSGLIVMLIGLVRGLWFMNDNITKSLVSGLLIMLVGIGIVAYYFLSQKKYFLLQLDSDQQLFILYNKPDKKQFNEFIHTFYNRRAAYLRENYFYIDFDGDKEKQLARLKWLKNQEVITAEEFEDAKEEIRTRMI